MTDQNPAAVARPESCTANLDTEYPTCLRCGLAWERDGVQPACNPMTVTRLRHALLREVAMHQGSHARVVEAKADSLPAEPAVALGYAMEMRAVLLFVDRCTDSPAIIAELKRIARQAKLDAMPDEADAE